MGDIRTYGGWRRRRGVGLMGLDMAGTFVALGLVLLVAVVASVQPGYLPYLAPPVVVVGLLSLIRVDGVPFGTRLLAWWRWWWGYRRGHTRYRAGSL